MRPPSPLFWSVILLAIGTSAPGWANSVEVSAYSYYQGQPGVPPPFPGTYDTSRTQCAQSGTSSASCEADFSTQYYSIQGSATANATAAWGSLAATVNQYSSAHAYAATSFSDNVIVTGGTGTGTLISHYTLVMGSDANGSGPNPGGFVFVQGATRSGVTPQFVNFWTNPPTGPQPAGCEDIGLCFSESFDVSSPVSFGTVLPLGALIYMDSAGFDDIMGGGGSSFANASSTLQLDGFTVLDGDGDVVSDAVVTPQDLPASFNLDFTPEPGAWGFMLMGLAGLALWRWRRKVVLPMLGLVTVGGAVPARANSVDASAYAYYDGPIGPDAPFYGTYDTSHTQCAQSGTSSASCQADFGTSNYLVWGSASADATAAWGSLTAAVSQGQEARAYASTSFSDDVIVTGGTGTGTLISHYKLLMQSYGDGSGPDAGGFVFAQGAARTGVPPQFANYWVNPPTGPVPTGCAIVGLCFSESFDVSSPVSFGAALPLGALIYMDSEGFGDIMGGGGTQYSSENSALQLDGFTVLDGDGNVVSDAVVTPQNLPASFNLDFTPEPATWGLMLLGLAGLVLWRWRRKAVLLPVLGLVAMCFAAPAWANSVEASAYAYWAGPGEGPFFYYDNSQTQCAQSGTSSASCEASFSTSNYLVFGDASAGGTAAWGSLTAGVSFENHGTGHAAASFSDDVTVTGGGGLGRAR